MDDITATYEAFKHAMSKTVSGKIIHGPERNRVKLPEFGYLYGEVKAIVQKLLQHKDFDSNPDRSKIVENRAARDKVFLSVAVDKNLGDALMPDQTWLQALGMF